jgi:hypothetical protein
MEYNCISSLVNIFKSYIKMLNIMFYVQSDKNNTAYVSYVLIALIV